MPAACRIPHTVDGATVTPSFTSSPWIRRCPHIGFSLARRMTTRAMPVLVGVGGRPGLRRLLVSYFPAASRRCQASSVAGVRGKGLSPAPARYKPRQRGEPGSVTRLVPHPARVPSQYRVLMPEHQQLGILRQVPAEHHDGQAGHAAREQIDDLEQHPAS